jgi:hypothetical protein
MNPLLLIQGVKLLKDLSSTGDEKKDEEIVKETLSVVVDRPFWQSKRFWMTMTGILVPIINKVSGLDLSVGELSVVVGMIATYVFGKSHEQKG